MLPRSPKFIVCALFGALGSFLPSTEASQEKLIWHGTAPYRETEFKLALAASGHSDQRKILTTVRQTLSQLQNRRVFHFDRVVKGKYTISPFQPFVFKDIYFDSKNLEVFNSQSSYRLRYRWNSPYRFFMYQALPILRFFSPNRCEIQAKTGYQPARSSSAMSVSETRFEFRNESYPFRRHRNAPPPPWPEAEYVPHAQNGTFEGNLISPMQKLRQHLGKTPRLTKAVSVATRRERLHLSVPNPWGIYPNPNQVFIVTIDFTSVLKPHWNNESMPTKKIETLRFLEIEVEPDRSTLRGIREVIRLAARSKTPANPMVKHLVSFSESAKQALFSDLRTLRLELRRNILQESKKEPLELKFKYQRIAEHYLDIDRKPTLPNTDSLL